MQRIHPKTPSIGRWLELIDIHASFLEKKLDKVQRPYLEAIDLSIWHYLNNSHWEAVQIYKYWVKKNPELNNHPYGLPNLYFARAFEEFFNRNFKQTLRFFKYAFSIYPDCSAMWKCLIQMYFLNYMDHNKKIDYTEIKREILNYDTTNMERIIKLTDMDEKENKFAAFFAEECKQKKVNHSSTVKEICDFAGTQIKNLINHRDKLFFKQIKEIILSASVKIAEIYCNFKFQYFIAISDSTPIIIIEKEHIKLENRGFILFYKLATQLHNDYLYCESNRNTTSGICSTNDLAQTLNKARKKDLWISIGDKGKINYNDVSKAIENIRKKLTNHFDDKNIVHLIKNIYKTGYMLDNNPSRVKISTTK